MNRLLYIMLLVPLLLYSCKDNETEGAYSSSGVQLSSGIVGKWYTEDETSGSYQEDTYTNSGIKYSTVYRQMYGYQPYQTHGKYTLSGSQLTDNMTFDGTSASILSAYSVDSMTTYSYKVRNSEMGTYRFNRILGTANMYVGDNQNLNVAQYLSLYSNVIPDIYSYSVADESIVGVDNEGNMIPKLSGDTYIKVETSQGTAVIKASVTDSTSIWNDYSKGLGQDFAGIEKTFGKYYAYRNDTAILYLPQNVYVDSVKFFCKAKGVVDSVAVDFAKDVDKSLIERNLNSQLVLVDNSNPDSLWYADNSNYLMSTTSAHYSCNAKRISFSYIEPEWDDKIEDFGSTFDQLKEKYGSPKVNIGNSLNYGKIIQNEFVTEIQYMALRNINKICDSYSIFFGNKVTPQMVEEYVNRNFHYYNSNGDLAKNIIKDGKECYILISPDCAHRTVRYYFYTFK